MPFADAGAVEIMAASGLIPLVLFRANADAAIVIAP
jgi:hypothetical protein